MEVLNKALAKYGKLLVDHRLFEAVAVVIFVIVGAPELAHKYATSLDPQATDAIVLVAQLLVPVIMGHKIITAHTERAPSGLNGPDTGVVDVVTDYSIEPELVTNLKELGVLDD